MLSYLSDNVHQNSLIYHSAKFKTSATANMNQSVKYVSVTQIYPAVREYKV